MISIYCCMAAIYVYTLALISTHPAPTKDRVRGCLRCCCGAMGAPFQKLFFSFFDAAPFGATFGARTPRIELAIDAATCSCFTWECVMMAEINMG